MPSPAAAGVIASTVYLWPWGLQDPRAAAPALAVVLVPAFLMVSTVRFRSIKAIDVGWRRSYFALFLGAIVIALIATNPRLALVVMAYSYLVWRRRHLRGTARLRRRPPPVPDRPEAIGSFMVTAVPRPFSLSTETVPPLNSMLRSAIGRPRPVPVVLVEK